MEGKDSYYSENESVDGHFTEVEVLQELSNILSEISINESVRMHEDTNIGVNGGEN